MAPLERGLLLGAVSYALLLVVARTVGAGAGSPMVLSVASRVGVVLALMAFVAALSRGLSLWGADDWQQRSRPMSGTSWRQRRAMLRALRESLPVAEPMWGPALAYTWMRGAVDRQMWMPAALALVQAAQGGGRYDDVGSQVFRLCLVVLAAALVVGFVLNAARWRRIRADLVANGDAAGTR